jgi:hypothetical protein
VEGAADRLAGANTGCDALRTAKVPPA